MTITNAFLTYTALGYGPARLVPITPPDAEISESSSLFKRVGTPQDGRGKTPGVRNRAGLWHSFDWVPYEADEEDLTRWHAMGAGVGVKTGAGLVAIDADTTDAENARIIRDIVEEHLGRLPVRVGRYPKALYLARVSEPYRYTRVDFGARRDNGSFEERVEILSDGRQFVAHGIHPGTREPYHWPRAIVPLNDLPAFTAGQLDAMMSALRQALPQAAEKVVKEGGTTDVNQKALTGKLEHVRKAVEATPNTSATFATRESYRDFGYAIKAALPDHEPEAKALFLDWCARWQEGENDPGTAEADWNRMKPPFRRGAGWLYELAEKLNPSGFSAAETWFDPIPEDDSPFAHVELNASKEQGGKFTFLDFDEAASSALQEPAPPLIKGLIDQGTMSVLYGDSNVGKTFVAMDMAYHISTGRPYAGMRTEHALVVYVASEGGRGAKRRLAALRDKFGPERSAPLFKLLPSAVDLRRPDIDLNPFIADLKAIGRPIGLIVIDTLSRALAGGDENSSVDMGALVKHFDAVRSATSSHLMIVHHTGKDRAKGARGHTLLRAATDTEIEVAEGVISVTKQRDLDKAWTAAFELEVRRVGADADGDPVTSCTVRLEGAARGAAARLARTEMTPAEAGLLEALGVLVETAGKEAVSTSDIEAFMRDKSSDMTKEQVRFHLRNLAAKGHVVRPKRGFWAEKRSAPLSSVCTYMSEKENETEGNGGKTEGGIFA